MMSIKELFSNRLAFTYSADTIIYFIFYFVLFWVNPTIALLISFIELVASSNTTKRQYYTFYVLLSCWLGTLNMTKELFSDQVYYAKLFVSVDTTDLFDAVYNYRNNGALSLKEFFFNVYSICCHLITGPNPRAYFFILTVNIYLLLFLSIHKVLTNSNRAKQEVLYAILLMAFFTPFFIQSIHAVRQMLATSFVIYAIAYRAVNGKNHWLFLFFAFFIHNTTIFYIVLSLLPYLYKKMSAKQIGLFLFVFCLFSIIYVQIGALLDNLNMGALSSVGERLMEAGQSDESQLFSMRNTLIYAIPVVVSSFLILKREYQSICFSSVGAFAYLTILSFILIISFSESPTVQFRYMFYVYTFFPFVVLVWGSTSNRLCNLFTVCFTLFFVLRFFFVDVDWSMFAPWSDILSNTFIDFLVTPYYNIY